jgi:DNA-binding response OmpR family regulator
MRQEQDLGPDGRGTAIEATPQQYVLERGTIHVDLLRAALWANGNHVHLTLSEYRLLVYLMLSEGTWVRTELLEEMLASTSRSTVGPVRLHVLNLRRKLNGSSHTIQVLRNQGYRVVARR